MAIAKLNPLSKRDFSKNALFACLLLLICSFMACKKDKKEEEKKPALGSCDPVSAKGRFSYSSPAGPYTYETSGGGKIVINPASLITITHADYPGFFLDLWGDLTVVNGQTKTSANHESLNGKHLKDRIGTRRTILFPDGAKITMVTGSLYGALLSVSIYDGAESHYLNPTCNTLEHSSTNQAIATELDNAESDGETGAIEFTATGLLFVNLYTENVAGNKVTNRVPIGEIYRDQPTRVNDYYP